MRNPLSSLSRVRKNLTDHFRNRATPAPAVSVDADHALVQHLNHSRLPTWSQFTYLFRYLKPKEAWVLRIAILFLFGSAAILVGRYINRHWIPEPTIGGTYTEAVMGTPRYLNPVLASSDTDLALTPLLFSGVLRQNPNGEYVNDLAEKVTEAPDGKTVTILLRQNLHWHDGTALTTDDVRFTIETIQNPNVASPRYTLFRGMQVATADDRTVTLTLETASPRLHELLTVGILPAHIWGDIPPASMSTTDYNLKPIGNGPFKFKEFRKKELSGDIRGLTLERFPDAATPALLHTLKIRFVADSEGAVDVLSNGEADGVRLVNTDALARAQKIRGVHFTPLPLPQVVAVFFNLKKALFTEQAVRTALRDVVDPKTVLQTARGDNAQVIVGPVLFGMPGADPNPAVRTADVAGAAKRLDDAGWKLEGEVRKKKDVELRFALTVPDVEEYKAAADGIVNAWKNIGAVATVDVVDPNTLGKEIVKERNFSALLYADRYDGSLDLYPFWHSTQSFDPGLNLTSFYSKDLDEALTNARKANVTAADRAKAYSTVQSIVSREAPAIFLYQPLANLVTKKRISTLETPTILAGGQRFTNATEWYVETHRVWKWSP
ncbi:MAG: peptide ABC transporter substrate-binding protein [Patescibacteria group bacterium]